MAFVGLKSPTERKISGDVMATSQEYIEFVCGMIDTNFPNILDVEDRELTATVVEILEAVTPLPKKKARIKK